MKLLFVKTATRAGGASARPVAAGYLFGILFAPKRHFFCLGAFDSQFFHILVVLYLSVGEMSVLAEDQVEAQTYHAQRHEDESCQEYFHLQIVLFVQVPQALPNK